MAHGASNPDDSLDSPEESSVTTENQVRSSLSHPPRTLFAEIFVAHDGLILVPTIESVSEVSIRMEEAPSTDISLMFVSVVGNDFRAFEREIEADPTVREATLFSASADQRVYRIRPETSMSPFFRPSRNSVSGRST
ncbi:hypothetical protein [Haladaptatus sp. DFWS20]|uniref:hypothetical protein n=1 Tax=Haladaptatus sp. DFWS20 TaxID=3403467 RepID=UPI003EBF8844